MENGGIGRESATAPGDRKVHKRTYSITTNKYKNEEKEYLGDEDKPEFFGISMLALNLDKDDEICYPNNGTSIPITCHSNNLTNFKAPYEVISLHSIAGHSHQINGEASITLHHAQGAKHPVISRLSTHPLSTHPG